MVKHELHGAEAEGIDSEAMTKDANGTIRSEKATLARSVEESSLHKSI